MEREKPGRSVRLLAVFYRSHGGIRKQALSFSIPFSKKID